MLSVPVLDLNKKEVGSIQVPEDVFKTELRPDLLQTVVRWQLACRRQGTHSTKTKGEVRGGGKKPFKQKGTGEARQGTNRSPLMPGGGILFGPKPRDYSYTLPKEVRKAGLRAALSYLHSENKLWVVDSMASDGKTKSLSATMEKLGPASAVIIDDVANINLKRAARNMTEFKYVAVGGINVFDLLKYDGVILTKAAVAQLLERLGANNVN